MGGRRRVGINFFFLQTVKVEKHHDIFVDFFKYKNVVGIYREKIQKKNMYKIIYTISNLQRPIKNTLQRLKFTKNMQQASRIYNSKTQSN